MKNIPLFKVFMAESVGQAVTNVLNSGYVGEGPKVLEFEENLKNFFDINHSYHSGDVLTANSATSAEHLLWHMLKRPWKLHTNFAFGYAEQRWNGQLENKKTVLTTPLTCTATNWPILLNGWDIKWVDVDPTTMNMDLEDLENQLTDDVAAIQVVHWGGYPVDVDAIRDIVKRKANRFIPIIEDCAHAFGSKYHGNYVGTTGNFSTFSTQAIKHVTSVDGGFLISPFNNFSDRFRIERWYGIDRNQERSDFRCEDDIPHIGFKFHMNDVMATVGIENLKHAQHIIKSHQINSNYYDRKLGNIDGITLLKREEGFESAAWLYTMLVENRADFMEHMNSCGIPVSRVHERNDKHSSVARFKRDLPKLESFIDNMICIPVGWWVTQEDREYIVDCIKQGW